MELPAGPKLQLEAQCTFEAVSAGDIPQGGYFRTRMLQKLLAIVWAAYAWMCRQGQRTYKVFHCVSHVLWQA